MSRIEYSKENVEQFLSAYAVLDKYYLVQLSGVDSSLVSYFDENWKACHLIIDNDGLFYRCIKYLTKRGNKIFMSDDEAINFEDLVEARKSID